MLQSDIIAKLRSNYGLSSITLYTDATLIEYISSALKKISQYYPKIMRDYLSTVVDQTRYVVSKTGLIGIKEVYYTTSSAGSNVINTGSTFGPSTGFTGMIIAGISEVMNPSGAEIVGHDTFDLIPTPSDVQTVYYDYKAVREITELPDIFEEDVYALILHNIESEKFKKTNVQNGAGSNPYKFDRRGNINADSSGSVADVQRTLDSDLQSIVKSIKSKVIVL